MNNSTSFIIYALAIAVLIGVISTIIFKIHSKSRNSRIIKRIRKGDYCFDNLNELNDMESSRIEKGSKLYQAIILLFVIADAINYYVSFNSIYRENVFMLLILTMTLAIILDHAPNAIAEYIFSNEKTNTISVKNQRIACDELGTYTEGVKKIVIVSSLCQTMAPLNLTAGLDAYSNEDVINETVADLNNIMEIPSMEDIDSVEIFGAGYMDTSTGEQGELTALDTSNLESLWSAIFESAGATNVTFHSNTPDGNSQINDYPSVTPIKVSELNNYFICADSTTTNDNIDLTNNVLCFTETTLAFKPDSAELLSTESEALETLKPVITYATANSDAKLAIFAATAWGDDENALLELSANRAGTVKSLLIKAGVSEENIASITHTGKTFF